MIHNSICPQRPALILTVRMEETNVHTVLRYNYNGEGGEQRPVVCFRALVSIMVRKVVNVNTVPVREL